MNKFVINGKFLTRRTTGVDRFAREILLELDKIVPQDIFEVLIPDGTNNVPGYKNIKCVQYGNFKGIAWEQFQLPYYAHKKKAMTINLCNVAPLIKPDIVCICDMQVRANPSFYSKKFVAWYRLVFAVITRRARKIITISYFSKSEIEKYYPHTKGKISVVYCAWQHMLRIKSDNTIFARYPMLKDKQYYFAMSSMAKNKNFKWIVETAKLNPDSIFAVAGDINIKVFGKVKIDDGPNVIKLGYVTDEEAKALMEHCKAFLFPTFYEGFGIPPLEALSCNVPILVSDNLCMHEIYGDSATYINPLLIYRLSNVLSTKQQNEVLYSYQWRKSAIELLQLLRLDQ